MKYRILTLALLLTMMIFPVFAQADAQHQIQFDDFGFAYDEALATTIHITQVPTGIDAFPPAPAHTMIEVIKEPKLAGDFGYQATIRLYRTDDVAGMAHYQEQVEQLQTLINDRTDLAAYTEPVEGLTANALPLLPVIAEGQTIRAAARYIDNTSFAGIRYLTAYQAAVEPLDANILFYTYQGLSKDGKYVISVMVWLENSLFPHQADLTGADVEAFRDQGLAYWQAAVAKLNAAESSAFNPGLDTLDALVQSFTVKN